MLIKKLCLSGLSAIMLLVLSLNPVYSVTVSGRKLDGQWSRETASAAVYTAQAAADEISQGKSALPEYELKLHLSFSQPEGKQTALARALLDETEGVKNVWRVLLDGEIIGIVSDPSVLMEAVEICIASEARPDAAYAALDRELTLEQVYTSEGNESDLMELMAYIRSATQVMSVTADGNISFAG